MTRALLIASWVVSTLAALGCSATKVEPDRIETPLFLAEDGSYRLRLPVGWWRDGNTLTRDREQSISFNAGPVLAEMQQNGIDPNDPRLYAALLHELEGQPGIQVVQCAAATFDGLPGFRMHFRTAPGQGEGQSEAPSETLICGAIAGEVLFAFAYEASSGPAFGRDLETFERLVASFEYLSDRPGSP